MNEGTMKIGLNLWVWESPFRTDRHLGLLQKARALRAEAVEFALEEGSVVESSILRRALAEQALGCSIIGMFGTERDLSSPDASVRQMGIDYARKSLELCAEVGAAVFSGACVGGGRFRTGIGCGALHSLQVRIGASARNRRIRRQSGSAVLR